MTAAPGIISSQPPALRNAPPTRPCSERQPPKRLRPPLPPPRPTPRRAMQPRAADPAVAAGEAQFPLAIQGDALDDQGKLRLRRRAVRAVRAAGDDGRLPLFAMPQGGF